MSDLTRKQKTAIIYAHLKRVRQMDSELASLVRESHQLGDSIKLAVLRTSIEVARADLTKVHRTLSECTPR